MLVQGDCLEELKRFPDNHFTAVVTDPPFGISVRGSNWDKRLPDPEIWREVSRTCQQGAYLTVCSGRKTLHRLSCHIEDAGFEVVDIICWIHNLSKSSGCDLKCGIAGWENYGSSLTSCWDPILLAQKRYEGTKKQLAINFGCGSLNLSRIGNDKLNRIVSGSSRKDGKQDVWKARQGRLPQNIVLDNDSENILESIGVNNIYYCPSACSEKENGINGEAVNVCSSLNNDNIRQAKNFHPTVKHLDLMTYLLKLTSPPTGGRVLDPFCGSGTTLVACKRLGVDFVGIDLSDEYLDLAEQRLDYEKDLFNLHEKTIRIRKDEEAKTGQRQAL